MFENSSPAQVGLLLHRHFVVAPVAAAIFLASLYGAVGSLHLSASAVTFDAGAETFEGGSMLVTAEGKKSIRVGAAAFSGFSGAFHFTRNGDAVTAAAITTPVLVSVGGHRLAIPIGMQWRASLAALSSDTMDWSHVPRFSPLPDAFLRDQLKALAASSPDATGPIFPAPGISTGFLESVLSAVQFPEAQKRVLDDDIQSRLSRLEAAAIAGDIQEATRLLQDSQSSDFLAPAYAPGLETLLSRAADHPAIAADILPFVTADTDLWVLASLHPRFAASAWTLPVPMQASREQRDLRLLMLPWVDTAAEEIPALAAERWAQELMAVTQSHAQPAAFVDALLGSLDPVLTQMERQGYPERLRRYAASLLTVAGPLEAQLSDASRAILNSYRAIDRIDVGELPALPPPASSSSSSIASSSSSSSVAFNAKEVEDATYNSFNAAGAAFTLKTEIHAVGPHKAAVTGIIFAGKTGDRPFTFTYDTETRQVSDIVQNGQILPYSLSLEAFTQWTSQ